VGGRALDGGQGGDQFRRHLFRGDMEVLKRALRLRSPKPVGGYVDRAETVAFDSATHGIPFIDGGGSSVLQTSKRHRMMLYCIIFALAHLYFCDFLPLKTDEFPLFILLSKRSVHAKQHCFPLVPDRVRRRQPGLAARDGGRTGDRKSVV